MLILQFGLWGYFTNPPHPAQAGWGDMFGSFLLLAFGACFRYDK
jgi:hypothetical protein